MKLATTLVVLTGTYVAFRKASPDLDLCGAHPLGGHIEINYVRKQFVLSDKIDAKRALLGGVRGG
jgi:hypothetical protein